MRPQLLEVKLSRPLEEIADLLKNNPGLDVNDRDDDGSTALHVARDRFQLVKLLLAHPTINVNAQNNRGETAFLQACKYGYMFVVRQLLKDPM